jgi:tryptophanyl-tRNA synthetase
MTRPRIFSGMRPTGALHLGNFMGALENWVKLQDRYECVFGIVDWHSLTTDYAEPAGIRENMLDVATDWLAAGLDPKRSLLMIQSLVPEHAELHLLLSMIVPLPWLERVPTYKEQQQNIEGKDLSTYGFLGYPLLQTADIIVYRANAVPVGEDQAPHIELAREIVRRFNNFYGEIFPEPQTLLTAAARIPGTDGRKMSKSYQNAIYLKDTPDEVRRKINPMVTDPARQRRSDPGNPEKCPVFDLHKAFSNEETLAYVRSGCTTAGIGCLDCKKRLLEHLLARLSDIHARRPEYAQRPDTVWDILRDGSERARGLAQETMASVRTAMKVRY